MDITITSTMRMMLLQQVGMVMVLLLSLTPTTTIAQQMCDQCNCHISTTDADSETIYNMGIVCDTGTLTWYGASGGLLLELSPFIHGNFRGCFMVDSDEHTFVKFSQENSHIPRRNYRLKQKQKEMVKRLSLKHLSTSNGRSKEFCVVSRSREPVMLYIETERIPGVGSVPKVHIHYDMERVDPPSNHGVSNSLDDCRPCTKEEILDSYCSMEFAVIGSLSEVKDNLVTDKTDITLAVKQIIHSSQPNYFQRVKRSDPHLTGNLVVPKKCRVKKGNGDFLFTGRMRLGKLSLKCAPYLRDWREIQNEAECTHS